MSRNQTTAMYRRRLPAMLLWVFLAVALLAADGPRPAAAISYPDPSQLPTISELPDPFRFLDGTRVSSPSAWPARREELAAYLQHYEYGHLPPAPTSVSAARSGSTLTITVAANGRQASFSATLRLPSGSGPFPAIIMLNPLAASATSRGYAEVSINPNSIAADSSSKTGAFWQLYGSSNLDTGVLMAWAWGVHRTLDALRSVPEIDTTRVGVSGYSRYGKAALVAGAFDERIAATFPGSSGTAGMGNYRFFFASGSNNETLDDIVNAFPFWFTARFTGFRGRANRLPFDQHSLAALVAPRLLLTTNGTEGSDIRTNPQGTSLTYRAARIVYEYLGVPDRIGIAYRPGGHQIDMNDYNAIMDFADKYLKGLPVSRTFNSVPYPPSAAAIPWSAPSGSQSPTPTSPAATRTPTPVGPTATPTRVPTATATPVGPTATPGTGGTCSPVTSTVASPFTYDGAGTFCWRANRLGSYINSWNLASLQINGVDYTNRWSNSFPAAIDGYWYISYSGQYGWSHFEIR